MEQSITKVLFYNLILVCVVAFSSPLSAHFTPEQKALFEKTNRDFFETDRNVAILNKCLLTYQTLLSKVKDEALLNINYAYALYYQASYVFPKNTADEEWNTEHRKLIVQYAPLREKNYRLAADIASAGLDIGIKDKYLLSETYFTLGLSMGELAELVRSMFLIIRARNNFLKALEIFPDVRGGALYLGLGRMYDKTPGILFGNKTKSMEFLNMAITRFAKPNVVAFYYKAELMMGKKKAKDIKEPLRTSIIACLKQGLSIGAHKKNTPEELDGIANMKRILALFTK